MVLLINANLYYGFSSFTILDTSFCLSLMHPANLNYTISRRKCFYAKTSCQSASLISPFYFTAVLHDISVCISAESL